MSEVDAATDTTPPETPDDPTPPMVAGPGGFPLPPDATEETRPGMTTASIKSFTVPRARDAAADEIRALLAAAGWTIDSDEASPRGSIRIATTNKNGEAFKVSIAGDDSRAAIIITLP